MSKRIIIATLLALAVGSNAVLAADESNVGASRGDRAGHHPLQGQPGHHLLRAAESVSPPVTARRRRAVLAVLSNGEPT